MNEIVRMRLFNSISLVGSAVAFALVGFVPDDKRFLAAICPFCCSWYKFEKSFTLFISPLLFLLFVQDESNREQWRIIFIGMAIILFVANTFFWFFVTDQPAEFTKIVSKQKSEKE
ncbi:unnamed protein product [Meloidogyne enterolobii]|uniref:Uncharacterized protein n=1 Tax=Meloidogyne enterolobii TaxID=390850 RepID=A0ACB0Z1L8_MELEN